MEHVNHFLREIGKSSRHQFKKAITAVRVGGADQKGYDRYMGRLRQQERVAQRKEAQATGRKPIQMRTYEEEIWMSAREHVKFADMAPEEQAKLKAERESLWGQIPAHLQDKARKLAGR